MSLSFDAGCGEQAISDQNIDFDVYENMVEIMNMRQWKCTLTMTAMVKSSAQIEPFQVSKRNMLYFILL